MIPGRAHSWNGKGVELGSCADGAVSAPEVPVGGLTQLGGIPAVGTTEGVLLLELVHPAGRQAISGEFFLRGAPAFASGHLDMQGADS